MPIKDFFTGLFKKNGTQAPKTYKEADNLGSRQDNMSKATSYWLVERMNNPVKPPFTLFIFSDAESAEAALLELPYIHKATDSGKLICERLMTFGFYATTTNGSLDGEYEAIVCGNDLTLDEFTVAEAAFTRHGGKRKNSLAPSKSVKAPVVTSKAQPVKFKEKFVKNGYTYEVYTGADKNSAMAFLKDKPVTQALFYLLVYTPEGNFGRDKDGIYQM